MIIFGRSLTCIFVSNFGTKCAGQLAVSGQFEVVVQRYGACSQHGAVYAVNRQMAVPVHDLSTATRFVNQFHARPPNIKHLALKNLYGRPCVRVAGHYVLHVFFLSFPFSNPILGGHRTLPQCSEVSQV